MKKIIKQIKKAIIVLLFPVAAFTGCELLGLDLQTPYEYDYEIGMYNNELNCSVWEFIQARSEDQFKYLLEGIEYAEMQNMYNDPNATYLLMNNTAFNSSSETVKSYFYTHPLTDPNTGEVYIPTSLTAYPKEQVKELLLYHIVKGAHTWSNLPASSTWYDSYASADTAKVNLYLSKESNPTIVFNNFTGHYKASIKARTTNLKANNGSYVHVIESWLDRPTREQLRY